MSNEQSPSTEELPHDGWARQSQGSYDNVDSGGWGGPEHGSPTGPLPRLRRDDTPPRHASSGDTATEAHRAGGVDGTDRADTVAGPRAGSPGAVHADAPSDGPVDDGRAPAAPGVSSLFDLRLRTRATGALAPFAFAVVVLYLFLDYARSVFEYTSSAEHFGPGAFAGVLILLAVGLCKVLALTCVTRLALELCLNVAELARRG